MAEIVRKAYKEWLNQDIKKIKNLLSKHKLEHLDLTLNNTIVVDGKLFLTNLEFIVKI